MFRFVFVVAAALLAVPTLGLAQKYPSKTVEVVVPYAPGGGTDNLMRTITGIIDENKWSPVPLNVNNRAGGSGAIGYNYLINKKGDPHVIAGATPMIVSGKIEGRLPGNHRDAMTVLMIVAIDELMLSVRNESPYKTIEDFVKAAKAKPGGLTVGGTATLTEDHIFTYLFEKAAGIQVKYVPFNSGGEVTAALMGGHIDAAVENPNEIVSQIEAGKAKNLAVAAQKRLKDAPDVPTFAEKGYKFYWEQMRGVVGPANMDKAAGDDLVERDPVNFASNTLEIAVPPDNPAGVASLKDLSKPGTKVVVCAPEVPCGSAAQKVQDASGVTIKPVSEEQSVTDVLNKVQTGEADAGLVYVTDVKAAGDKVKGIRFPESSSAVNTYPVAVLADSKNKDLARQFVDLVTGDAGQQVLADAGFAKPSS